MTNQNIKIVSFNINSIRAHWHQIESIVKLINPEVITLQETKVTDVDFPLSMCQEIGFEHVLFHGEKTHRGVAIMSKLPLEKVQKGFLHAETEDAELLNIQTRLLRANVSIAGKTIELINGYFPQGENRSHEEKFPFKIKFYKALTNYLKSSPLKENYHRIITGDMNIAPEDIDIGIGENNRKRWLRDGKCAFLPEEREMFTNVINSSSFIDTYRALNPKGTLMSWFDYRSRGFEDNPKRGLRIDFVLADHSLAKLATESGVDYETRGLPKPSDHAPIWTSFKF